MLSPHTVREYVKDICRRAGVHGYEKLISRLSSASSSGPLAIVSPRRSGLAKPPEAGQSR